ncbi:MAG: Gfo/Idh/MocA family oxidoreductase, partial [Gallionellaceae bacterium]
MAVKPQSIQRILVIGAGRGGTAMLEIFLEDPLINIVGIIDANPQAPALAIAKKLGIPHFTNLAEAIEASRPCLAFNLTGDDSV